MGMNDPIVMIEMEPQSKNDNATQPKNQTGVHSKDGNGHNSLISFRSIESNT